MKKYVKKPLILISNDDGITSPGIAKLVSLAAPFGELVVVAPDSPQSGMGHAITIGEPLRMEGTRIFGKIQAYECSGTPADCVKLAKSHLLKDRPPALVLSGINHGSNVSINVLYSGTMSAAIEGALGGLPSIGFSLCDYDKAASMAHIDEVVEHLISYVLKDGLPKGVALNVNLPAAQKSPIAGVRFCRQAKAHWTEEIHSRKDPHGRQYFWMEGDLLPSQGEKGDDLRAIAENYVAVVPCHHDFTDYTLLKKLQKTFLVSPNTIHDT